MQCLIEQIDIALDAFTEILFYFTKRHSLICFGLVVWTADGLSDAEFKGAGAQTVWEEIFKEAYFRTIA